MKTILLIDDHDDSREIFRSFLTHLGYRAIEARNGSDGLRMIRQESPDVVVLNLLMPEMGGHEFLQHLRDDPATAELPCLVLTGDARFEQMGRAVAGGADVYMTKPAEPREVCSVIETLLDETGTANGSPTRTA